MPEVYQKARRAHSLPSPRYMIPSAEMGEYENPDGRRRSAPAGPTQTPHVPNGLTRQQSHLYPLDEEGTYGRLPRGSTTSLHGGRASSASRRERKPKVYSSYSVDSNCSLHTARKCSVPKKKTSTCSVGSRSSSTPGKGKKRGDSLSPDRGFGSGSSNTTGSRSSMSPEPNRRRPSSTMSGYSTSTSNTNGTQRHHYSSYSRTTRDEKSFEEKEEYEFSGREGGLSLNKMRMPTFDTWDSMGILGLTSKMWHDTKKRQDSFMESTGHFLREERDSYIM
ncbi:uncharacterized protein [Lepeophtheirus salmonis]|uniref:uncharacterized protein n=1 Tax=Lepeophtheirus salmonis TaxID=72036 RepID=UPI001AE51968|nr:serine/arginine repetitive matrix protein 4-like [Lepeophtheirus salmonis]